MSAPGPAVKIKPIEIEVTRSFEEAFRKFKTLVQKERIIGQVKARREYEKPSEKKRRKRREAYERKMLTEMREKMIESGEWEKRKKKKDLKKSQKIEKRIKRQENLEY